MTKNYRTTRALRVTWGPAATPMSVYETDVPAGHRVVFAGRNGDGSPAYFADNAGLVDPRDAMRWHDAVHYGIRLPADAVEEVAP